MQQTNNDVLAAARLALQEMERVRQQGFRITQMRQGPALPPGGLSGLATGPFQSRFQGVMGLASPEAERGLTRTQAAAFGLAFTLGNLGEQLAATDNQWQKLDRTIGTALQALASAAVFFGPTGMLIGAVAIVGNFLSAFWTQQREEADRTAKAWEESLKRLTKSRDIGGASGLAQELFSGPGGVQELQRRIDELTARREEIGATRTGALRQSGMQILSNQIRTLQAELDDVTERHRDAIGVVNTLADAEGRRVENARQIAEWQRNTPEAIRERTVQETQRLIALERGLIETGQSIGDVHEQILRNQVALNAMLDQEIDKRSTVALQLRQMLVDIEKADVLQNVLRTTGALPLPGVGVTPAAMPTPEIQIPQLEVMPITLGQQIRLALQPLVDTVKQMGSYLLSAGLGMLSQYGGAGGQALAGIIGGAVAGSKFGVAGGIIGGLVGVTDALFSMGRAAREARKAFMEFLQAQELFILQQQLALGDITQAQFDAEMLRRQFAEQKGPIEQRIEALTVTRDEIARRGGPLAADTIADLNAQIAELQKRLDTLNDAEARRLDQLLKEKDALDEMTEAAERFRNVPSWFKVELETWRAANVIGSGAAPDLARPGRRGTGGGVTIGRIVIHTAATDGRALFDQILAEARRRAAAVHGAGATDIDLLDLG